VLREDCPPTLRSSGPFAGLRPHPTARLKSRLAAAESAAVTARSVVLNLLYHAATVIAAPGLLLHLEGWLGLPRLRLLVLRVAAVALAVAAVAFQLWCITVFQRIGRGRPSLWRC